MIFIKSKEVVSLRIGKIPISAYYHIIEGRAKVLWQAVRSCFGSGMWNNDKPWIEEEAWKDNK